MSGINFERGDRRFRSGRNAVVDVHHAVDLADLLLPVRQRAKVVRDGERLAKIGPARNVALPRDATVIDADEAVIIQTPTAGGYGKPPVG